MSHMLFQRPGSDRFLIERLPDGSAAVLDRASEAVHSLNQTAAAVWECCAEPCTVDEIAEMIQQEAGVADATSAVEAALTQLVRVGLVEARDMDAPPLPSRRQSMRAAVGLAAVGIAAPLVLTLTIAEQNVRAQQSGSGLPTTPTPTPPVTPVATPTPTVGPTPLATPTPVVTPTPLATPTPPVGTTPIP